MSGIVVIKTLPMRALAFRYFISFLSILKNVEAGIETGFNDRYKRAKVIVRNIYFRRLISFD